MGSLLKLIFINKFTLFFLASILLIFYFISQSLAVESNFAIMQWLLKSNYILMMPTMLYICWCYNRIRICAMEKNHLLVRIGEKTYTYYIFISILSIVFGIFFMYVIPGIVYFRYLYLDAQSLVFIFLKITVFVVSEAIYLFALSRQNVEVKISITASVILNFVVHYYIILK